MADVNEGGFRMDVQHHAMHDAYERVVKPEVGGEGDYACVGHALAKYSQQAPESSTPIVMRRLPRPHAQDQPSCNLQAILIIHAVQILRPGM